MMAARMALAGAAMLLMFALGWAFAPTPSATAQASRGLRVAALRLDPPAGRAADAAAELARLHGGAPPPPVARATATAPIAPLLPPPPQADAVLRSQLAAVEGQDGDLRLVLAGARRLKAGDAFMGWRVAALSRTSALLSRDGERRTVDFFAPARAVAGAPLPGRLAAPVVEGSRSAPTATEFFSGFKG